MCSFFEPHTLKTKYQKSSSAFLFHFPAQFMSLPFTVFPDNPPRGFSLGQALDRLVHVSFIHYCTSTSCLSTSYSSRGLTFRGISHLEGGFTLRCLQRLSLPDLATLPWRWSPTGSPAVRPSRSSRTKDSSSQISSACAG